MCCGNRMNTSEPIRMTSVRRTRAPVTILATGRVADPAPLTLTDDVLFRWARIVRIAKMFPIMHTIRALEQKVQAEICRGCKPQHRVPEIDRSTLAEVRRQLAECSDEKARLVKESAGILQYRVRYHDLAGTAREIVR